MSKKRTKSTTILVDEETEKRIHRHLKALGLKSAEEYKVWCREHGFSRRVDKAWPQQKRELLVATREAATARLAASKKKIRFPEAITEVFEGKLRQEDCFRLSLGLIWRAWEATKGDRRVRQRTLELLLHAVPLTDFLDASPAMPQYGHATGNTWIDGLVALAHHWYGWLRPVQDWKLRTHNTRRQFASLARYLLTQYPVPSFMDSVWFLGTSPSALRFQRWFWHIGTGNSIRMADVPIPLTKRMAHYFVQAPSDCSVAQALRWGQVLGLGGNPRLARAIITSRLGDHFENDDFWITVIRFFIDNPMLDTAQVGPIIDYLHSQRSVEREEFVAAGVIERRPPPQPNLSMKGRSPNALLRQVERWHRQLANESVDLKAQWPTSGIGPFDWIEGREGSENLRRWTIRELLGAKALVSEGRAMQHCVATYVRSCAGRSTSIWSLQMHNHEGSRRILTVEVRLSSRTICQARGKRNAMPDAKSKDILHRWASQQGLRLADYL